MSSEQSWDDKAREAFEAYIEDLKRTLPPNASFAEIERAMLKFSPAMMRKTAQALVDAKDFSPDTD